MGDFYGAYDAQDTANEHAAELGIQTVPSLNVVYTAEKGYVTADVAKEAGLEPLKLGHQIPQDAPRGRGHPGVVRLQVGGRGAQGAPVVPILLSLCNSLVTTREPGQRSKK